MRRFLFLASLLLACGDEPSDTGTPIGRNGANGAAGNAGSQGEKGEKGDKGDSTTVVVRELIGNVGSALPVSGQMATQGGRLLVTVSGSAYRGTTGGVMGFDITVDGTVIGSMNAFANEFGSHKAFAARTFVVENLIPGQHTFAIAAQVDTLTDANDFFNMLVQELK